MRTMRFGKLDSLMGGCADGGNGGSWWDDDFVYRDVVGLRTAFEKTVNVDRRNLCWIVGPLVRRRGCVPCIR